jgi:hypothetical protein
LHDKNDEIEALTMINATMAAEHNKVVASKDQLHNEIAEVKKGETLEQGFDC